MSILLCWFGIGQLPKLGEAGYLAGFVVDPLLAAIILLIMIKSQRDWRDFALFTFSLDKMRECSKSIQTAIDLAKTMSFSFCIELLMPLLMSFIAGLHGVEDQGIEAQEVISYHALCLSVMLPFAAAWAIIFGIFANIHQSNAQIKAEAKDKLAEYTSLYDIVRFAPVNNLLVLGALPILYGVFAGQIAEAVGSPSDSTVAQVQRSAKYISAGALADIAGYAMLTILRQICSEYKPLFSVTNAITLGSFSTGIGLMFLLGLWPESGIAVDEGIGIGYATAMLLRAVLLLPLFVKAAVDIKAKITDIVYGINDKSDSLFESTDESSHVQQLNQTPKLGDTELDPLISIVTETPDGERQYHSSRSLTPRRSSSQRSSSPSIFSFFSDVRRSAVDAVASVGEYVNGCCCFSS